MEDVGFEWNYNRIQYWQDPGCNYYLFVFYCKYIYITLYVCFLFVFFSDRSAGANGTGTGHQDAPNSEQTVLFRCEAEPQGAIYKGGGGK